MKRTLLMLSAIIFAGGATVLAQEVKPAEPAQAEAPRARRANVVRGGFLGVELDEVTAETARRLGLPQERGALITTVIANTGASAAGLQKDDVVIKWNGEPVESAMELTRLLRETPAGRTLKLTIVRGGREMDLEAKLGERVDYFRAIRPAGVRLDRLPRPERPVRPVTPRPARVWTLNRARLGLQLGSMNEQLAEYFGVKGRGGALVLFVHADSPAAKAGIKAGDVILSVAGKAIEGAYGIHEALAGKQEGPVEVKVVRDRQEQTLTVQLEKDGTTSWMWEPDLVEVPDVVMPLPVPALRWRQIAPKFQMPVIKMEPIKLPKIVTPRFILPAVRIHPRAV
ncbi:MAG TPA: PDZ domain-containing protein [Blastocatellia bacterium]|jgi:serine protease Do